jgi:hypothetical protein
MSEPVIPDETERLRIFLAAAIEERDQLRAERTSAQATIERFRASNYALEERILELRADNAELLGMLCAVVRVASDYVQLDGARALIAKYERKDVPPDPWVARPDPKDGMIMNLLAVISRNGPIDDKRDSYLVCSIREQFK